MALALYDRVKETTTVAGTGTATLLGATTGFQSFAVVGNANTTYYCIADQGGANWEVGIGTYTASGTTLARTTVLSSSNAGSLVTFTAGIKDVFVTYPSSKGLWKDASGNAIGLGTPAAFVGTNITGTASGLTAGNVTTNANLTGAITSSGNATSLGSFTSLQLATALTNETGTGSAVFSDNASLLNPTYTGTLTGSTGILNIGSGQVYKDASGNVGIGVTPPAWASGSKAISFDASNNGGATGNQSGIWSFANSIRIANGMYFNGTSWVYSATSQQPSAYYQVGGAHIWQYAAAGTAGGTLTPTEAMRIDSSGNVGIGTSSSNCTLTLNGAGATGGQIQIQKSGTLQGNIYGTGTELRIENTSSTPIVFIQNTGAEYMRIGSSGIVTMNAYGAGAATFSAAGVISSVSDETWKIKDGAPIDADSMLKKLEPGYWFYNEEKAPIFGTDRQLGFYAQNVNEAIGIEAAPTPEEGKPWGYYDRSVLAVTVMSLQKALTTIEALTARLTALEAK